MKRECRRCGECCLQGGPTLHSADLWLVREQLLPLERLIAVREGELAHNPISGQLQQVRTELVKIQGQGKSWACAYYRPGVGCGLQKTKPAACVALKCWEVSAVAALVEVDTLSRRDILPPGHYLLPLLDDYDTLLPVPDLSPFQVGSVPDQDSRQVLAQMIIDDVRYRQRVSQQYGLTLDLELFCLGRPLFQALGAFGARLIEKDGCLQVLWQPSAAPARRG